MSLSTVVLLSSFLLALVILYGFTKDRWAWKKIVLTLAGVFLLLTGLGAVGIWWVDQSNIREAREQEARERNRHEVKIGDSFNRVIQRQGVPDTIIQTDSATIVIGYWDERRGARNIEKVFSFSADSLLTNIRFVGDSYTSIEYGWVPIDGVVLGTPRDSVEAMLGAPCSEEITETASVLLFPTDRAEVLRRVRIRHGKGRVVWHGWTKGQCED